MKLLCVLTESIPSSMARPALKVYLSYDFPSGDKPHKVALKIWNELRGRSAYELDGMALDVYTGLRVVPARFLAFLSESLEFLKRKDYYFSLDLAKFSRETNIRFVPFAQYRSDRPSTVKNLVEGCSLQQYPMGYHLLQDNQ